MRLAALLLALAIGGPATAQPAPHRWRANLTISDESDPRAAELGKVFGLAVDRAGNVYVADIDNAHVVVFGADGRFRGQVGRKGRGPGEFQAPTGIVIDDRDQLWVRDLEVVSRFVPDPRTGLIAKFDSAFRQPLYHAWREARASRMTASGDYLHTAPSAMMGAPPRAFRYTAQGILRDSILVPPAPNASQDHARYAVSANSGRMLPGLGRVPFAAIPSWDVTPAGTSVSSTGNTYTIVESDATGRMLRSFGRSLPPLRIDAAERAESLAALTRRLDTLPVPLSRVQGMPDDVREKRLPQNYPAVRHVFAERDGTVWVRRWAGPGTGGGTVFDVFDAARAHVRTVVLPVDILDAPTPVLRERLVVAAVEDRETGGVRLMRFVP